MFLNSVLNFVVISVIIFIFIRTINRVKNNKEPKLRKCNFCFQKIDRRATRCSFCTSQLEQKEDDKTEEKEDSVEKSSAKYLKKTIKKQLSQVEFSVKR